MGRYRHVEVLLIHGMGSQEHGYSDSLQAALRAELGVAADRFVFDEILWAPALRQRQDELWRTMRAAVDSDGERLPLRWRRLRRFLMHSFDVWDTEAPLEGEGKRPPMRAGLGSGLVDGHRIRARAAATAHSPPARCRRPPTPPA